MGVYIKGMEMPKNCGVCPFCVPEADEDRGDICVLCGQFPLVKDEKSCECPLVPVPPHGRLIDGDVAETITVNFDEAKGDFWDGILFAADFISQQPTIIEAEEE